MSSKILVVGDIMVDRYIFGDVERLSQEAPVPVVKFSKEEYRLGAAANVAANVASLGSEVTLIGIVGDDECAELVFDLVCSAGINSYLLTDQSIKTTQKLRVIGRSQQIVRIDFEAPPKQSIHAKVCEEICKHDIIVFSDYGKGTLPTVGQLITHAKTNGKTVIVDPKGYDYQKYRAADLVKPNINEMREMAGGWANEDELRAKADKIRADADIKTILLTRAANGMTLYGDEMWHVHAKAKEVYDVTGAGDTVMAGIAVFLSRGESLKTAAELANIAAGVAVCRFGTHAVTAKELEEACSSQS